MPWPLCYEEQFYAICGAAQLIAPRRFFQIMLLISVGVVFVVAASQKMIFGFFFYGRWLLFAAGVLVYYRLNYARGWLRWAIDIFLVISIIFTTATHSLGITQRWFLDQNQLSIELIVSSVFAFLLILIAEFI